MKKHSIIVSMAIVTLLLLQAASAAAAEVSSAAGTMMVNINEATQAELQALPSIGPSKAQAILTYRAKKPFKKVEDLMRVKGIGRKTFNSLRPYLTVSGATTVPTKKKTK